MGSLIWDLLWFFFGAGFNSAAHYIRRTALSKDRHSLAATCSDLSEPLNRKYWIDSTEACSPLATTQGPLSVAYHILHLGCLRGPKTSSWICICYWFHFFIFFPCRTCNMTRPLVSLSLPYTILFSQRHRFYFNTKSLFLPLIGLSIVVVVVGVSVVIWILIKKRKR